MMSGVSVDSDPHRRNDPDIDIYGLHLPHEEGRLRMDPRNTENEHKIPHLRNYTESLSLVSIRHSPLLSVIS